MGCNAEAVLLIQKVVVVKRIRPFFLYRDAENAVFLGQAPESNRAASKGAKSACCATSLLTSGQASARAAMKTTEALVGQAPAYEAVAGLLVRHSAASLQTSWSLVRLGQAPASMRAAVQRQRCAARSPWRLAWSTRALYGEIGVSHT